MILLALALAAASVSVDLTEAPRRLVHSQLTIPARPGTMALVYPKWIPGEHGPNGPIDDIGGLVIRAQGRTLPWRRDPVDMYRLLVDVPQGAAELQVSLDYLSPPPGVGHFTGGASMTEHLAIFNWHTALLYPEGVKVEDYRVHASYRVPQGWKAASAFHNDSEVSLAQLEDSPVLLSSHLVEVPLGDNHGAKVVLDLAAETDEELQLNPQQRGFLEKLVREEAALFGARHFDDYHFLLALTDSVPSNGIEHHQSSDNRLPGRALLDPDLSRNGLVHLLAHESTHSWNGKYRRPLGLATHDFQAPMKGDLLWVYEGLTQYLGTVLTARSGQWDAQALRDYYAIVADEQQSRAGRRWRPVQDTATAAQVLYGARGDWSSLRRGVDFYPEGDLIWLEVDARLREAGSSLDEFCRAFHGGGDTGPKVVPYGFDDVVRGLDALAPRAGFRELLRARLDATGPDAPLEGLARAGFRLDYASEPTSLQRARDKDMKRLDLRSSVGIIVSNETDVIADVIPGRPADRAGVMPGARIVAVDGRRYTPDRMWSAVEATKRSKKLELLLQNADSFRTFTLEYDGGLRFPRLVPIAGRPDLLAAIGAPKAK